MAKQRRDLGRERLWREAVAAWQSSGLNVRHYCQQLGLRETSFYYWRRELK
jgi:hypothetical protein